MAWLVVTRIAFSPSLPPSLPPFILDLATLVHRLEEDEEEEEEEEEER